MDYKRKILAAAATAAMLVQTSLPAFAATTLIISGNGSDSDNEVEIEFDADTTVVQSNQTAINNDVDVESNTGDNEASDNTGGDVSIETGDTDTYVKVDNLVNSNTANVDNCGACLGDVDVLIEGNGSGSKNEAELENKSDVEVYQTNVAKINNDVDVDSETGNNEAEDNTGGDVTVKTGDADATVKVFNTANANSAVVAGGDGGDVELIISGNGSDSDNEIDLELDRDVLLVQENYTQIENDVDVDLETGKNEAEDNTGGDIEIETGYADAWVMVDNMAGFNFANVEDCCFDDIMGKVAGNGSDSKNEIEAELDADLEAFQDNICGYGYEPRGDFLEVLGQRGDHHRSAPCFDNDLDIELETGDNEAEDNTSEYDGDPSIKTGGSDADVELYNTGGSNAFGVEAPEMEEVWEGMHMDFSFSFNLDDLLAFLADYLG